MNVLKYPDIREGVKKFSYVGVRGRVRVKVRVRVRVRVRGRGRGRVRGRGRGRVRPLQPSSLSSSPLSLCYLCVVCLPFDLSR